MFRGHYAQIIKLYSPLLSESATIFIAVRFDNPVRRRRLNCDAPAGRPTRDSTLSRVGAKFGIRVAHKTYLSRVVTRKNYLVESYIVIIL